MKLTIASIAGRARSAHCDALVAEYAKRTSAYLPVETVTFRTSEALFEALQKQRSRIAATLVLLDSSGRQFSSEELARWLRRQRDEGRQRIIFAVGPADGWSNENRAQAGLLLSLGAMTLPHELARVVLSEQMYRAFTILAGHPYHTGH
ncbi:MAG TPA: 23S rRNA (pseudouridine(1915)-N(3))-methyltransferase RlmH [Silvibacterium sp.]|jgi:23S rRNA (pseudouridine1915-N3)-methyltransferase|nr:23S rRNA (pseudouridine(1915)-N(3))-methyltransferase RlmH [Silvibacterium sp.]